MIAAPLRQFLDACRARYDVIPSGARMTRTVLVRALTHPPGQLLLVVVPAEGEVDLAGLHERLGFPVELAPESDLGQVFPGYSAASLPPIGELAVCHVPVFVDASLSHAPALAFVTGPDGDVVELSWAEYDRIARHTVVECARSARATT